MTAELAERLGHEFGQSHSDGWWDEQTRAGRAPARCTHVRKSSGNRCRAEALYDAGRSCGRHGFRPIEDEETPPPTAETPDVDALRKLGFARRACARCGWRFFTTAGLWDHQQECDELAKVERRVLILRERGLAVTALNNARRVRCETCDKVSTPAAIGAHQRFSGHVGRAEVPTTRGASSGHH